MEPTTAVFVVFGLLSQAVLVTFFAARRWKRDAASRFGWIAYLVAGSGLLVGAWLGLASQPWTLFTGPLLMGLWAMYGAYIDLARHIEWRVPLKREVFFPYVTLYFLAQMFLWWPLWDLQRMAWLGFAVLFSANTLLNLSGHFGGDPAARYLFMLNPRRAYHRAELEFADRIPKAGPAIMVSNHGRLDFDSFILAGSVLRTRGRLPRLMVDHMWFKLPLTGRIFSRAGAVDGTRPNATALLGHGELILTYPGGVREIFGSRFGREHIDWRGRTGFAAVAIATSSPVIPVVGIGVNSGFVFLSSGRAWGRFVFQTVLRLGPDYAEYRDPLVLGIIPCPLPLSLAISFPLPCKVRYIVGEPIYPAADSETELADRVAAAMHELIEEHGHPKSEERADPEGPHVDATDPTLEQRVARATSERVDIIAYDPAWPSLFEREREHLLACLPPELIVRIEHFGSTAVPGLAAKPIVDMLVEVTDLARVRERVVPILEAQGYDYFWRPTFGDDGPPFYAWFIKRDPATGVRTHHIHMVERGFREHWDRLLLRDFLIAHPGVAEEYAALKLELAAEFPNDRVGYTQGKTDFIVAVMDRIHSEDPGGENPVG